MKYLIKSQSLTLFEKGIEKIVGHEKIQDENIFAFDFSDKNSLINTLKEYSLESLFGDKKLIILKNFNYSEIDKKEIKVFDELVTLKTNNVLVIHDSATKAMNEEIVKQFQVFNLEVPQNLETFLIGWLKNKNIVLSKEEIKMILSRTKNNFELLSHEIQKIKHLEQADVMNRVEQIIYDYKESTPFAFLEYFLMNKQVELNKEANKLINEGYNEIFLLGRLIAEVNLIILYKMYSDKTSFKLDYKISDYRFRKIEQYSRNWLTTDLLDVVEHLLSFKEQLYKEKNLAFNSQIFFYKLVEILII